MPLLAAMELGPFLELAVPYALPTFFFFWFFWLGACIGSFLNVVIYRVPAGLNLFYPPSRCPKCEHPIRLSDNVPILGWLRLRGRCRDCGLAISPRYPIVEAILAVTFAVVASVEVVAERPLMSLGDISSQLPLATLWVGCLLHLGWLATAFSVGMVRRDGKFATAWIWVPLLIAATVAVVWEPSIQTLDFGFSSPLPHADRFLAVCIGGGLAMVAARIARFPSDGQRERPVSLGAATLGIICGWQAATVLILLALGAQIAISFLSRAMEAKRPLGQTLTWYAIAAVGFAALPFLDDAWRRLEGLPGWIAWISFAGALLLGRVVLHFAETLPLESEKDLPLMEDRSNPRHESDSISDIDAVGRDGIDLPEEPSPTVPDAEPGFSDGSYPTDPAVGTLTPEEQANLEAIIASPSYRVAYKDVDFLHREGLRPVRLQLELLKVELALTEQEIHSTIVVFGGTQVVERADAEKRLERARVAIEKAPEDFLAQRELLKAERILAKSRYYDEAREFGRMVSEAHLHDHPKEYVIITGGGPGAMEAANRGAMDVGAKSIGLNIVLPEEQHPNPHITPELCFQFHYFALRKMHFLLRAKALVVFPGGYGTLDELFEVLTLTQTGRMPIIPTILVGREYWENVVNFQYLADEGVIRDSHLQLMEFADTAAEAWNIIQEFYAAPKKKTKG
ncbi:MAG TPA: TIGR00730 family Rossman fold protein [Pirellulaceae bacterium]|jgi:hypothetical protein|nr:TIGR00730 family Rossman fold protein [Pirellulaceae bacterium]